MFNTCQKVYCMKALDSLGIAPTPPLDNRPINSVCNLSAS